MFHDGGSGVGVGTGENDGARSFLHERLRAVDLANGTADGAGASVGTDRAIAGAGDRSGEDDVSRPVRRAFEAELAEGLAGVSAVQIERGVVGARGGVKRGVFQDPDGGGGIVDTVHLDLSRARCGSCADVPGAGESGEIAIQVGGAGAGAEGDVDDSSSCQRRG